MVAGDVVPAVVVTAPKTGAARLRIGPYHADLEKAGYAWTRKTSPADLFKPGDLIDVAIVKIDDTSGAATVTLDQAPIVEGAIVAIENRTGQIKMMDTLGPKNVLDFAKRFGFEEDFPPYLPIALGAGDATLLEITSAYTTFPNQGVRMKPFTVLNVKDRDGNLLEENRGEPSDVIRADTAYVMPNMLRGVLSPRGTGPR